MDAKQSQEPRTGRALISTVVPCRPIAPLHLPGNAETLREFGAEVFRFRHPSGLAVNSLSDAEGRTVYTGLRHDAFNLRDLGWYELGDLPASQLRALVYDGLALQRGGHPVVTRQDSLPEVSDDCDESRTDPEAAPMPGEPATVAASRPSLREVFDTCHELRTNPESAPRLADPLKVAASRRMAWATANAALAADPENLERAIEGGVAAIRLCTISVVNSGALRDWMPQIDAYSWLRDNGSIELCVSGRNGLPHAAAARVGVRQIVLTSEGILGRSDGGYFIPSDADQALLGGLQSAELAGDIRARVDGMRSRADDIAFELEVTESKYSKLAAALGSDHPDCRELASRRADMTEEKARLDRDSRRLEASGQKLKDTWRVESGWPTERQAKCRAAAQIALVARMMGETPVLSCSPDDDVSNLLDAEITAAAEAAAAEAAAAEN